MSRLFGTSGIRGVVNLDLKPEIILDIGSALAACFENSGTIVLGKDPRLSSDMLEGCLVSGILSGGCDVKKIGLAPTPAVGFATPHFGAKAGIMITASHNPPEFNGVKFFGSDGMAFTPGQEEKIENAYFSGRTKSVPWNEIGNVDEVDILPYYIKKIVGSVSLSRGYKVVVDCACGAGALATPFILRELGCKVIALNSQLDGFFPGRALEPTPENLQALGKIVKSLGADIGLAHDGDADRIAAVDDKGRVVGWDKMLALMSAHSVERSGGKVVTTVDASMIVDELVNSTGGEVVRTRVGDVAVAQAVKSNRAVFGGEPSGAWIFPEVHICPDGPLAGAKILEMIDEAAKPLSKLADDVPEYPVVRDKIRCPNAKKVAVMRRVATRAKKAFEGVGKVLTIDGVRLTLDDGAWVLIRPSGTEPYIRITAEARYAERANALVKDAKELIGR